MVFATLIVPNIRTYLIWGEVQYAHNPTFGYVLTATFTLKSEMDMARGCRAWRRASIPEGPPRRLHGIGSAVVDLIFSIANRDVTFLSGTAAINLL